MVYFGTSKASSTRKRTRSDTMRQDIQHVYRLAQIDPCVDNTHVSTQQIIIRKITVAQLLQSQAFVLHSDVIELLIILLSRFFNLLYTVFILKITCLFITTSRGLISSTAVSLSKKESVWISFNEFMRAETEHCTSVLWRDEQSKIKQDIRSRILAGGNQDCHATHNDNKTLFTLS